MCRRLVKNAEIILIRTAKWNYLTFDHSEIIDGLYLRIIFVNELQNK